MSPEGLRAVVVIACWALLLFAFAESVPFVRNGSRYRRVKCAVRPGHHRGFVARQMRVFDLVGHAPGVYLVPVGSTVVRRRSMSGGDALTVFEPARCVDCGEPET